MLEKSGFSAAVILACLSCACGLVDAKTFYWHRDPQFSGDGDMSRSFNWTANQDGTGAGPASNLDDDFSDTLISPWAFVDSVRDGMSQYSFTKNPGKLTLTSRGFDFWTDVYSSNCNYAGLFRSDIHGDFDVRVKVDTQTTGAYPWSKSGIMALNNADRPGDGGVAYIAVTPSEGIGFFADTGGTVGTVEKYWGNNGNGLPTAFPVWLRLVKNGGTFSGFYRHSLSDPWTQVGLAMAPQGPVQNSMIGLFNLSHNTAQSDTVVFDDFEGGGTFQAKALDLSFKGTGPTHDVNASLSASMQANSIDFGNYPGTLSFLASTLSLSGSATFSQAMKVVPGTGALAFTGASAQVLIAPNAAAVLPNLVKSGTGTLSLAGTVNALSYAQTGGTLDLNGQDLILLGNLQVNGDSASFRNLDGRTITAGGYAVLSGIAGNLLDLNPYGPWSIKVAGTLNADYALVANSKASGSPGIPSATCVNGKGNLNWRFPNACDSVFKVSPDTTVDEGRMINLRVTLACATSMGWSVVSGPAPRILDPEAINLSIPAPRVAGDTSLVFRVSADFGSGPISKDIRVNIKEAIPDPAFTLPAQATWNGARPLVLRPTLTNASALKAALYPADITYAWRLSDNLVDESTDGDSLVLSNPTGAGSIEAQLCLSNGGRDTCRATRIQIEFPTAAMDPGGIGLHNGVFLDANGIAWLEPRQVTILAGDGRAIWTRRGSRGSSAWLPAYCKKAMSAHAAWMVVTP